MVVMFELFRKSEANYHVNPRFRAYGKARIDIAQRAATRDDWDRLWKNFPAEVGFFIDILGFPVNAFDPDYAMFTSPSGEFFFSVVPVLESEKVTPPDAFRLQFMVDHIMETAAELERRGVKFEQWPTRSSEKSPLLIGSFHTPNGIGIDLWGIDLELDSQDQLLHSAMKEEDTGNLPTGKPVDLVEEQEIEEGSDLQQDEDHIFDSTSVDNDSEEVEYLPNEDL
jgi:catechol 2,3-dioxygenase-like lactoylglutathione lyase family enzyme